MVANPTWLAPPTTTHEAFVQIGIELAGIGILVMLAGINTKAASIVIVFLVLLWLLAMMVRRS